MGLLEFWLILIFVSVISISKFADSLGIDHPFRKEYFADACADFSSDNPDLSDAEVRSVVIFGVFLLFIISPFMLMQVLYMIMSGKL